MTKREKLATKDVAAALLGRSTNALSIVRQAYRLRTDHTDELVQFGSGSDCWLAARLGNRVVIWAYNDAAAADDAFDHRITAEPGWREALPAGADRVA